MPVELILLCLSPLFLLFIGLEYRSHRERYDIRDSLANGALALMHQASDAIALLLLMPAFYWLHSYRLFDITLSAGSIFIAFILQDFLYYWFHRASHNIHWLWAAHVVHHSSTRLNFSTAFRQSVTYPIAGMWLFWMPMIVVGFDPLTVFAVVALNLAYQFFVHTQAVGKLGWLEQVFNTPSHHRVHHAINAKYIDKNFGGVLIIWDKLFGSFVEEDEREPCRYGILGQIHTNNVITISFHQWKHMLLEAVHAKGIKQKLAALFTYPTYPAQQASD
ncbi:MAG: sterol desaturase family protein [Gammaproteobacteria bacterium]|nr:sterol desaturase family protein [Gammaproteobacteria bacterium]